jgi:hypothetical protein
MTLIYAAAVIGGILLSVGWRLHVHKKAKYGATICILIGAACMAFSAIGWWSGLYRMGSGGLGLVLVAVVTASCVVDVVLQVFMKHQKFKEGRTSWIAAVAGVGVVIIAVNFTGIYHSVKSELNSRTVTQVVDQVSNSNG